MPLDLTPLVSGTETLTPVAPASEALVPLAGGTETLLAEEGFHPVPAIPAFYPSAASFPSAAATFPSEGTPPVGLAFGDAPAGSLDLTPLLED